MNQTVFSKGAPWNFGSGCNMLKANENIRKIFSFQTESRLIFLFLPVLMLY